MNKIFKPLIVLTLLLIFAGTSVIAQDKYQYATISWAGTDYKSKLCTSINGTEFTDEEVVVSKEQKSLFNANPLLSKVSTMQDKGWEVVSFTSFNFATGASVTIVREAYLRKKQ